MRARGGGTGLLPSFLPGLSPAGVSVIPATGGQVPRAPVPGLGLGDNWESSGGPAMPPALPRGAPSDGGRPKQVHTRSIWGHVA